MADLDVVVPGTLLYATKAGSRWRQAVALAAAQGIFENPTRFLISANGDAGPEASWEVTQSEVAMAIRAMNADAIIETAVPTCPDGLKGAIAKLGFRLMAPQDYRDLVELFTSDDAEHRRRTRTLRQVNVLDADILHGISTVDPVGLMPDVVLRLRTRDAVARFNDLLAMIRSLCSTASDDAIAHSLTAQSGTLRLTRWAGNWLEKADRLPALGGHIDDDPELVRITPENSASIGREFNNCMQTKSVRLASGVWTAWVIKPLDVIAALTKVQDGWLLTGIHGRGNLPVEWEIRARVAEKLRSMGIHAHTPVPTPARLDCFGLARWPDFEDDFEC